MFKDRTSKIYSHRFSKSEQLRKNELWKILCKDYFQGHISSKSVVMDIGAGHCEFINNIQAKTRIAVDLNPDLKAFASKKVKILNTSFINIPTKYNGKINTIFMSNFLEHLKSKDEVLDVLVKVYKLLKTGGKVLILQPNIDLIKNKYWDFIDHRIVLNSKSLKEALEISGFKIEIFVERFLPYTTKSVFFLLPSGFLKIYLRIPSTIRPFAGQSLAIAIKPRWN